MNPDIRVLVVTEGEDYLVVFVDDANDASLIVEIVLDADQADARVAIAVDEKDAVEFLWVVP